jgi:hypothetical protein
MYNIYYNGELLHSNLNYEDSMDLLRQFAEEGTYDPQKIEMLENETL